MPTLLGRLSLLVGLLATLCPAHSFISGGAMLQSAGGRTSRAVVNFAAKHRLLPSMLRSAARPGLGRAGWGRERRSFCLQMSGGGGQTVYVRTWLEKQVSEALVRAFGDEVKDAPSLVAAASKPEFGDYQCNAAMPLAKSLKSKPRDVAVKLLEELKPALEPYFEDPEIAGPGFLNLRFKTDYIASRLSNMAADEERLGIPKADSPSKVIVDFSSPNIAKEMHVGHLRSTIIGDTLSRLEEFLGHDVLRLNHVGDWGTQFGMLITYLREKGFAPDKGLEDLQISDLVELYKQSKKRFDDDADFQDTSRKEVVKLQGGDKSSLQAWRLLCEASRKEFQEVYDMLDISLEERGESFYNPMLTAVVKDLKEGGLLEESEGAQVVFCEGFTNKDGERLPLLVQKTDGGFMYATTDLAAVRHRVDSEKAKRVLYVTDAGQANHFTQVFQVAARAGWVPEGVELVHVPFGLVQGEDGKKFKTRSGDTVKLRDLLDEAIDMCEKDMEARMTADGKEFGDTEKQTARVVGLSAVKYADLSMNRESNYKFSYKKMLSLSGNTAPYMLYAYARINGIYRKIGADADVKDAAFVLDHPSELALARHLLMLPETLIEVEQTLYPHKLCEYLFDLSQKFNRFYEDCPVAQAESEGLKRSRAALCAVTARSLKLSLNLLGIKTVDRL